MKAVGIKNLKNNLSRYLDLVREGETLYVTDRDEVIAEIHRPVSPAGTVSRWEAFLNEQERRGVLLRAKRREARLVAPPGRPKTVPGGMRLQELLDATRRDRD